jgi:uncharacterized protein DUF6932
MEFDQNGNLLPNEAVEISLEDFREQFIGKFKNSSNRTLIFDSYLRYLEDFKREITTDFFQFINGSFVTRKQNPNDMDSVTFVDYKFYEQHESKMGQFKGQTSYSGIDAYIEKTYPENHHYYIRYRTDLLYWDSLFTKNRQGQRKGFIKIIFGNAEE